MSRKTALRRAPRLGYRAGDRIPPEAVRGIPAQMGVSGLVWALTIVMVVGLMLFDYTFQVRNTHVPTLRESAIWSTVYIGIAFVFGLGIAIFGGPRMAIEYFAG